MQNLLGDFDDIVEHNEAEEVLIKSFSKIPSLTAHIGVIGPGKTFEWRDIVEEWEWIWGKDRAGGRGYTREGGWRNEGQWLFWEA